MFPNHYLLQQKENIIQTYEELHALAEPSWKEEKTSVYLQTRLADAGLILTRFANHHGFFAEIPGKTKEVIALRADMDALVQEVDGQVIPNHSCGHDAHSTMVLHTALWLASLKQTFDKTVRFIFQPAEEVGAGALQMIQDGVLDRVSLLIGIHLRPWMEVPYGKASPVILHRASATIKGKIMGKQAHAARPKEGINPLISASELIRELQQMEIPNAIFSVTMTHLESGHAGSSNVIPEHAVFALDVRAQNNETMALLQQKIATIINNVMNKTGTMIQWKCADQVPAAIKNDSAIIKVTQAIASVLGSNHIVPVCISPGGEDFHFYSQHQPEMLSTMVGLGCDLRPGLHDPHMHFRTDALIYGTEILTTVLWNNCNFHHHRTDNKED
ncbi:amidohydrolase [Shimazuella kribbensis]|uniref:amidohydrolase n=1 Tax=Shimazuella kribbensis TaxID=139808 RepID=UPI00042012C9|nr:amidohydrolase [Shimazuella kribbensis]